MSSPCEACNDIQWQLVFLFCPFLCASRVFFFFCLSVGASFIFYCRDDEMAGRWDHSVLHDRKEKRCGAGFGDGIFYTYMYYVRSIGIDSHPTISHCLIWNPIPNLIDTFWWMKFLSIDKASRACSRSRSLLRRMKCNPLTEQRTVIPAPVHWTIDHILRLFYISHFPLRFFSPQNSLCQQKNTKSFNVTHRYILHRHLSISYINEFDQYQSWSESFFLFNTSWHRMG